MKKLALALLLLCSACHSQIQHGLSEQDANQIKAVLEDNGIEATPKLEGGREAKWAVEVPQAQASQAIRILRDNHLPRAEAPGLAEVFGSGSAVPTATEERALLMRGLSGEVARMLEGLEGVVQAKVLVVPSSTSPGHLGQAEPGRASIFLKVRAEKAAGLAKRREELQALVAGAVPGLAPAQVAVLFDEVTLTPRPAVVERKDRTAAGVVGAVAGLLVALLCGALVFATLRARKLRLELESREPTPEADEPAPSAPAKPQARKAA